MVSIAAVVTLLVGFNVLAAIAWGAFFAEPGRTVFPLHFQSMASIITVVTLIVVFVFSALYFVVKRKNVPFGYTQDSEDAKQKSLRVATKNSYIEVNRNLAVDEYIFSMAW